MKLALSFLPVLSIFTQGKQTSKTRFLQIEFLVFLASLFEPHSLIQRTLMFFL